MKLWLARQFCAIGVAALAVASPAAFAGSTSYTYDALGRVTLAHFGNGATTTYSYDAAGNRTSYTTTAGALTANPVSLTVSYNSSNNAVPLNVTGGTPTSVTVSSGASHGAASANGTSISYSPNSGYSGGDSFQYTASNAGGASAPATVAITVTGLAPVAGSFNETVTFNSASNNFPLQLSGGVATSVAKTGASHGSATVNGVSSISYTPTTGYSGSDSISYTGTNAYGTSAPGVISITVTGPPPLSGASIPAGSSASGTTSSHTFNPTTVTVTGGSGSYSYAWTAVGDGYGTWATGGAAVSFTPSVTHVTSCQTSYSTYTVVVTDTVAGGSVTSNGASYNWSNNAGCGNARQGALGASPASPTAPSPPPPLAPH